MNINTYIVIMIMNGVWYSIFLPIYSLENAHSACVSEHNHKRYDVVTTLLDNYQRPMTILDLGASDDWLISKIAHRYEGTMVIISRDATNTLEHFCSRTSLKNLVLLKKELSLAHLERLAECEHFDVVLVLDDFNALPLMRKHAITHLVNLGDYTILEIPQEHKQKGNWTRADEIRMFLVDAGATILDEIIIDDARVFVAYKQKKILSRSYWDHPCKVADDDYVITSSFDEKYLYKRATNMKSAWRTGINLHTFKALLGIYPSQEILLASIETLRTIAHNDCNPCNVIVQGSSLAPIDFDDPRRLVDQKIGYERLSQFIHIAS